MKGHAMSSYLIGRHLLTLLAGLGVLAAVVAASSRATLPGRNGLLAYQATVGDHTELFTIKPDGTGRSQVTRWTDSDSTNAEWSPDGRRILFARSWTKPHPRTLMYTMNADGRGLHAVNAPLRFSAIWLPDGRHLLGIRALRFVIVNADGSGIRDAGIPGVPGQPCFLGTGGRFAELTSRSDGESAIFIGRIGGGNGRLKRITSWKGMNNIACSPDGSEIAFNSPSDDSAQSANVFTVNSDGGGAAATHSRCRR